MPKRSFDLDGVAVTHREASRDLFLFIHGLGCSKESFRDVWRHDAFKGFSILTLDLPGFGDSKPIKGFSFSMEDQAGICDQVLTHFEYESLHVAAHSMGGAVGLLMQSPIKSYVSIEGNLIAEDCGLLSRKVVQVPYGEFESHLFLEIKKKCRALEDQYFCLNKADPYAFYYSAKSLVELSDTNQLLDRFKSFDKKRCYVYGDKNRDYKVLESLSDIRKIEISASGHFPMIDNPTAFYSELALFFSE